MTTFTITNDREAAWVLARYARARQQLAAIEDRARDLRNRATTFKMATSAGPATSADYWHAMLTTWHTGRLRDACTKLDVDYDNPDEAGWKKVAGKTEQYPTGTLRARRSAPGYAVTDKAAFMLWLLDTVPAADPDTAQALHLTAEDAVGNLRALFAMAGPMIDFRLTIDVAAPPATDTRFAPAPRPDDGELWPVVYPLTGEVVPGLSYLPAEITVSVTPDIDGELAAWEPAPDDSLLHADLPFHDDPAPTQPTWP